RIDRSGAAADNAGCVTRVDGRTEVQPDEAARHAETRLGDGAAGVRRILDRRFQSVTDETASRATVACAHIADRMGGIDGSGDEGPYQSARIARRARAHIAFGVGTRD